MHAVLETAESTGRTPSEGCRAVTTQNKSSDHNSLVAARALLSGPPGPQHAPACCIRNMLGGASEALSLWPSWAARPGAFLAQCYEDARKFDWLALLGFKECY